MTHRELRVKLQEFPDQDAHAEGAVHILLGLRVEDAHAGMTIRQLRWKLFADVEDDNATVNPGVLGTLMASGPRAVAPPEGVGTFGPELPAGRPCGSA